MSKKDNKKEDVFPFSIITEKNKIKLKTKAKNLKKIPWIKFGVVVFISILIGSLVAVYQRVNDEEVKKSNQSQIQLRTASQSNEYHLEREELSLAQQEKVEEVKEVKKPKEKKVIPTSSSQDTATASDLINLIRPVKGAVLVSWQEPYKDKLKDTWNFNDGLDIKAEIGTKVKAAEGGKVKDVIKDDYLGTTIIIKHNSNFETHYSNLQNIKLTEGQKVAKGQIIAEVGDSGINGESKLHFEVIEDNKRVSPKKYLN